MRAQKLRRTDAAMAMLFADYPVRLSDSSNDY